MGLQFSGGLNHIGKTTGNKKFISSKHYFNMILPSYFASWWHKIFLTKQLILFNFVEFFILCRSLLNSAASTKQHMQVDIQSSI